MKKETLGTIFIIVGIFAAIAGGIIIAIFWIGVTLAGGGYVGPFLLSSGLGILSLFLLISGVILIVTGKVLR